MTIKVKMKHAVYAANAYVWIKYGVISDLLRMFRHTVNAVTGVLNAFTDDVNDVTTGVENTVGNIRYNTASVVSASDSGMIKLICASVLILFLLFKFCPSIVAMFRSEPEPAKRTKKSAPKKTANAAPKKKVVTKQERFDAWYNDFGANYKTKRQARKAFDEWEFDNGYV